MEFKHISVLLEESLEALEIDKDGIYIDGTMGGAGHSMEIVKKLDKGKLIGIDQDINAINKSKEILKEYKDKVILVHDNFKNIKNILKDLGIEKVDGVLLDLGVSSYQLDTAARGFSYHQDAPLDMRMNEEEGISARDVINNYSLEDLDKVVKEYGEERWSKRIAQFIVDARKEKLIESTGELVQIIKNAIPKAVRSDGPHPARRTFQAIRIEVNQELEILKQAIIDIVDSLNEKGRVSIITFHSLEDRIVKETFKYLYKDCICPKEFPICTCEKRREIKIINKKPILASKEELTENKRARSAKLRIAEKI
ncbi:16S rRNA (cytosine(1402)-N(4))-methyltransferase RsmH [Senegalia sp. (in: firmicutes)]|uniref:16S rRNA (cytosine(1402)-N(4))-methyltransferase RsmH n=1 Tax=Senegalia sp. (in: firmicutes) TaxID=1924098 RepID=UPI003F983FFF